MSKKEKMFDRASAASNASNSIQARLAHATELAGSNPLLQPAPTASPQPIMPVAASAPGVLPFDGRIETVPLSLIDQNPFNARRIYRPERVAEMKRSIDANGQDTPGIATIREGRYVLVAGHYRFKALQLLGRPMVLIIRPDLTDRELYELSYRENVEREDQSAYDNAQSWAILLKDKVYANETELAEATGMSLANVNKTLASLKLSPSVAAVVQENPSIFGVSVLYEIHLLEQQAGEEQSLKAVRAVAAGEMSRRDLEDIRSRLKDSTKSRKQRELPRTYKIKDTAKMTGELKHWDSGKVILELTVSDAQARHELMEDLKQKFGLSD